MTWLEVSLLCVVMCLLFVVMSSIDDMGLAGRWVIVSCADVDVDVDRFIWRDSDLMLRILYTVSCDFVVHKSKEATNRKAIPVRKSRAPFSRICNQNTLNSSWSNLNLLRPIGGLHQYLKPRVEKYSKTNVGTLKHPNLNMQAFT